LGQDVELFSGSVAENIARMSTVDSTKVLDAAMRAGLHELILKLPKGYETQVGESGAILPGGIRQRIGLARAFYGNPTLLVLDEPDANLDDLGLMALDRALIDARASGAIVWVASHREALRKIADRVIEMPMNPQPQKLETT
jgi:ATP-binding cassette subfamily C exporter for protease/lipase